jgi:carboxymethylenebutenolidase
MRAEQLGTSYLALPDRPSPHPGVVVVHEFYGLNENIRDICRRLAAEGYAALGVDLFAGRNRPVCIACMFLGWATGRLDFVGVRDLKAALGQLAERPEVDAAQLGALGFCLGGTYAITWACTDKRLKAIAPYYGNAPRRREAIRRMCPVVGSWPDRDISTGAAATLETELTAAHIPHDLKVYPGTKQGFFNDQAKVYDAVASADSWQRVIAFFDQHVKGEQAEH